jgi:pyruvate dehydrogenase E1 component alpha subunit
MPKRTVYTTKIEYIQALDEHGVLDESIVPKHDPARLSDEDAAFLFERLVHYRHLDETAFKLQRSGRMYTYPQNKGQEAAALGSGHALRVGVDYLVPCYRENSALFLHGLDPKYILLHWAGDERGNAIPQGVNVTPIAIPIGTQMLHATGMAWAFKLKREDRVVCTYFGDGATSEGDFHEALNFATVFNVPCIFFCQNNQWAISVPRDQQMNSETVAQKAIAYGAHCIQVDGNDVFAVYKATYEARERARSGGGVTLIEAITYRLADHTTADDARRYRSTDEVNSWVAKDPMIRLRKYLESIGRWDSTKHAAAEASAEVWVKRIVDEVLNFPAPDKTEMFDHLFAELPDELRRQRDTWATHSLGQFPQQSTLSPRERR